MQDPLIGQQLANFRIERLIGRGGMAQVYYGWDIRLERPVAVKVIDARYRDNPTYAQRFIREAQAVAAWRHENIIQIYYADDQDGLYYFAMEFIDGADLGSLLQQYADDGELMGHEDVVMVGRAVAAALDYAHQKGVIHRDVKPANVMVTSEGRVVLSDFGLAMDIEQGSLGEVFGSPHYISPEQARSSADAVPQSDLYSLGVMLYEMLTGVVPFDDPSSTTVALQHMTLPPPRPCEINPNLNAETEAVLLRALSKQPDARYQSGSELMDALEAALSGITRPTRIAPLPPPPAEITSPPQPTTRPTRRAVSPHSLTLSLLSVGDRVSRHRESHQHAAASPTTSPSDDSLIGQQFDEYRLDSLLGKGGMARVYKGMDVNLQRAVAIKVIDVPFQADSEYAARFKLEAQAIARLEHPHIVSLYRYGQAQGQLYMAMRYVEGLDLSAVLKTFHENQAFIEPADALKIVREIGLALDYAHEQGVIHRDVKPSNILIDKQGNTVLTDFGLALLTEVGTRGEIFGSPHYMAPEQAISSARVVPQTDLYAMGVILYEMFTGQLPFDAPDPLDVAMMQMSEQPPQPCEIRPQLDPAIQEVILKAMDKEPANRYQSGQELADALEAVVRSMAERPIAEPAAAVSSIPRATVAAAPAITPPLRVPAAFATTVSSPSLSELAAPPAPTQTPSQPATRPPTQPPSQPGLSAVQTPVRRPASLAPTQVAAQVAPQPAPQPTPQSMPPSAPPAELPAAPPAAVAPRPRLRLWMMVSLIAMGTCLVLSIVGLLITIWLKPWADKSPTATISLGEATLGLISRATPSPTWKAVEPPTATSVSPSTLTPGPANTPTPIPVVPQNQTFRLLIKRSNESSIFVINQSETSLPVAPLKLVGSGRSLDGPVWNVPTLGKNDCVVAWKQDANETKIKRPDCNRLGEPARVSKGDTFWDKAFEVSYGNVSVGQCPAKQAECRFDITLPIAP